MRLLDLLKAAAGEAALTSLLGKWRQAVSIDLDAALATLGLDGDGDAGGDSGGVLALVTFGSFYALMDPDNPDQVAPDGPVLFPNDGPANGIVRSSTSQFVLPAVGTYEVSWQVSITEAAQLQLDLNGVPLANTVAGRATGTNQLVNTVLITTTTANSVLRLINPGLAAITITIDAGGTLPASAWLTIRRLA